MPLDSQGVYIYDDTEDWSPQDDYQNLGQQSVSAQLANVRAEISDLELLVDSDWRHITTLGPDWVATSGHPPRVRKVGDRVDLFGALTLAAGGSVTNMLTLPPGYIPAGTYVNQFIGTAVSKNGVAYTLYTASLNPGIVRFHPSGYFAGGVSLEIGDTLPLLGSWYVS